MSDAWRWKVADRSKNPDLDLRYEPGTWGDLIKHAWAVEVARALAADGPFSYLDPFAGAPTYPLVDAAQARIDALPPEAAALASALEPYAAKGEFPSTARLVLDAGEVTARMFDVDAARRAKWAAQEGVEVLEVDDGAAALAPGGDPDLVLLDPYDLFEQWEALFPAALAAGSWCVLAYLFNKAPRSAVLFRRYRGLRESLDLGGRGLLVGRMPSDAVLPRAWHEVLLIAPQPLLDRVRAPLQAIAEGLTRTLALPGAFEAVEGG